MNKYELTFLLNQEEEIKKIKDLLESLSGKLKEEYKWGLKTLAYPIKNYRSANFYHWVIEISPDKVIELKRKFNFYENLIRYLLLKIPTKSRSPHRRNIK